MTENPDYLHLRTDYQKLLNRDTIQQLISTFMILLSFWVSIISLIILYRLLRSDIPGYIIWRFGFEFILIFTIGILALLYLRLISRWSHQVKLESVKITIINDSMISSNLKVIWFLGLSLTICIIYLCIFIFQNRFISSFITDLQLPLELNHYTQFFLLYRINRWIAVITVGLYFIIECLQLIKWIKLFLNFKRLEARLIQELPDLNQLGNDSQENSSK